MILSDTKLLEDRITYLNTLLKSKGSSAEIHPVILQTASFTYEDFYKQEVGRTNNRQEGKEIFDGLIHTLKEYKKEVKELEEKAANIISDKTLHMSYNCYKSDPVYDLHLKFEHENPHATEEAWTSYIERHVVSVQESNTARRKAAEQAYINLLEQQQKEKEKVFHDRDLEDLFMPDKSAIAQAKEQQIIAKYKEAIGDATLTDDDAHMIMTELQGAGKPENKKAAIKHISRLATANEMSYDAAKDWLKAIIPV